MHILVIFHAHHSMYFILPVSYKVRSVEHIVSPKIIVHAKLAVPCSAQSCAKLKKNTQRLKHTQTGKTPHNDGSS